MLFTYLEIKIHDILFNLIYRNNIFNVNRLKKQLMYLVIVNIMES